MKKLIALVGPSGSGKSTFEKYLVKDLNLHKCISHTSRKIRNGEKDGVDYFFVEPSFFTENEYEFLENVNFSGNSYGLHKDQVFEDVGNIVVVEPKGLGQILQYPDIEVHSIFINVSVPESARRMFGRGDSKEMICKRMNSDNIRETAKGVNFDLFINSDGKSEEEVYILILNSVKQFLGI